MAREVLEAREEQKNSQKLKMKLGDWISTALKPAKISGKGYFNKKKDEEAFERKRLQSTYRSAKGIINETWFFGRDKKSSQLRHEIQELLDNATRNQDVMSLLADMRGYSKDLFPHTIRVSAIAVSIGKKLGLDDKDLDILMKAGLLHDVGKLRVPEKILDKPGELTREERGVMSKHPQHGEDILKETPSISGFIRKIASQHHELENGNGYPYNLKEDQIYKYSKIIRAADMLEAMMTNRVYKPAKTREVVEKIFAEDIENGKLDSDSMKAIEAIDPRADKRKQHEETFYKAIGDFLSNIQRDDIAEELYEKADRYNKYKKH